MKPERITGISFFAWEEHFAVTNIFFFAFSWTLADKRAGDDVVDSNQDAGAKKPKTTTHTASGNDSEVLSLIITKERLAKTTASVLRGSKVHVGSIIEASNTGRDALPISQ